MAKFTRARPGFSLLEVQFAFILLGIAISGMVPLIIMQNRHVQLLERDSSRGLHFLVPPTDQWAARLGQGATVSSTLPVSNRFPTAGYINFQRAEDPLPGTFEGHDYRKDWGQAFAQVDGGYWYGWSESNLGAAQNRDRPNSLDERYDTFIHTQWVRDLVWEVAVPNGLYEVHVVAGDAQRFDSIYAFDVEGLPAVAGIPTPVQPWLEGTVRVLVSDGLLTISNGTGALNNKLCFVEYSSVTPPNQINIVSISRSMTDDSVSLILDVKRNAGE